VGMGGFEFDVGALRQFALDAELAHPILLHPTAAHTVQS
jgi:hypothetical protein